MKVLDKFLSFLIYLSFFCLVTGGLFIRQGKSVIDVSSLTIPMALVALIFFILQKFNRLEELQAWQKLLSFVDKLQSYSNERKLIIAIALISGLIFGEHLLKYLNYRVATADAVFVNQSLFHPFGKEILQCDICWGGSRLSNHLGLSLLLYAPLISLFKSEIFIIFMQVIPLFIVIYFFITKGPLRDHKSLWLIALLFMVSHQAFRNALVWDFKEDHIGSLFLFLSLLALWNRKFILALISMLMTFISKEHTSFILPMLSIPIWFEKDLNLSKKERIWAIVIINVIALIWIVSVFKVLFPMFKPDIPGHKPPLLKRLGVPGETKKEILMNLFFNPIIWWMLIKTKILKLAVIKYIVLLYTPFIYLLRKRWWWLFATLSVLAMNLVSNFDTMRSLAFHYEVYITPMLLFGVMLVMKSLSKRQMVWALVLFLFVSNRWPARGIIRNIEGLGNISDSWYYSNLPDDKKYIAGKFTLPHLSHMKDIQMMIPELRAPKEYYQSNDFDKLMQEDSYFVIDTKREVDQLIKEKLLKNGFELISKTPSGRVEVYLKNPLSQN